MRLACGVLIAAAGWSPALPSAADVTLVYGEAPDTGERPQPTHQIHVQGSRVSIANAADKRLLIYDHGSRRATIVDHATKRRSDFDTDGVRRLAAQFLDSQRQMLDQIEKRMESLPKDERDKLRETVDMLQLANRNPEKLAAPVFRHEETGKKETFLGMEGVEAMLLRGDKPEALTLLATREVTKIGEEEFGALMGLQTHLESLARGLPADMQSWLGPQGMLSGDGRLALRILTDGDPALGGSRRMELLRLDHGKVEKGWFEVPEDYPALRLDEFVLPPVIPSKSENNSEK